MWDCLHKWLSCWVVQWQSGRNIHTQSTFIARASDHYTPNVCTISQGLFQSGGCNTHGKVLGKCSVGLKIDAKVESTPHPHPISGSQSESWEDRKTWKRPRFLSSAEGGEEVGLVCRLNRLPRATPHSAAPSAGASSAALVLLEVASIARCECSWWCGISTAEFINCDSIDWCDQVIWQDVSNCNFAIYVTNSSASQPTDVSNLTDTLE